MTGDSRWNASNNSRTFYVDGRPVVERRRNYQSRAGRGSAGQQFSLLQYSTVSTDGAPESWVIVLGMTGVRTEGKLIYQMPCSLCLLSRSEENRLEFASKNRCAPTQRDNVSVPWAPTEMRCQRVLPGDDLSRSRSQPLGTYSISWLLPEGDHSPSCPAFLAVLAYSLLSMSEEKGELSRLGATASAFGINRQSRGALIKIDRGPNGGETVGCARYMGIHKAAPVAEPLLSGTPWLVTED